MKQFHNSKNIMLRIEFENLINQIKSECKNYSRKFSEILKIIVIKRKFLIYIQKKLVVKLSVLKIRKFLQIEF